MVVRGSLAPTGGLVDLEGLVLEGVVLGGAILEGATLDGTTLEGETLEGAILEGATLEGAILEGATLAGVALGFGGSFFAGVGCGFLGTGSNMAESGFFLEVVPVAEKVEAPVGLFLVSGPTVVFLGLEVGLKRVGLGGVGLGGVGLGGFKTRSFEEVGTLPLSGTVTVWVRILVGKAIPGWGVAGAAVPGWGGGVVPAVGFNDRVGAT